MINILIKSSAIYLRFIHIGKEVHYEYIKKY